MRLISKTILTGLAVMALSNPIETLAETECQLIEPFPTTMFTTTRLNVREEPSLESEVYEVLPVGSKVEVREINVGWALIEYKNELAYLSADYLIETVKLETYTEKDLEVMAHVIAGEAQCYDDLEQRYVASVVLNRVFHDGFEDTVEGVVFEPGQYSCTKDGNYYREPTESNWANAKWILENGSILPPNVIYQSRGRQGKGVYLKTEVHTYCY